MVRLALYTYGRRTALRSAREPLLDDEEGQHYSRTSQNEPCPRFNPRVDIYDAVQEGTTVRYIVVECPGVTRDGVQWEEVLGGVRLMVGKDGMDPLSAQQVWPFQRECGTWIKDFNFDDGRFDLCEEEIVLDHGVLTVPLKKNERPRTGWLGPLDNTGVGGRDGMAAGISQPPQVAAAGA
eukprot:gnl/TRDRNA2_/TRDRNA2_157488_c2_seq1.p1 gnl/TRDRNA2_/TRDRNA2_157488_c2~~gnl/TRDRNA2_/TRDRNA2_157488_c2_seq1.p1  ORF type:complete len:180 (+),score=20.94 gnl/TRDRNA2_/TRDRNA2_157488_c2_seq1:408-947(+)